MGGNRYIFICSYFPLTLNEKILKIGDNVLNFIASDVNFSIFVVNFCFIFLSKKLFIPYTTRSDGDFSYN